MDQALAAPAAAPADEPAHEPAEGASEVRRVPEDAVIAACQASFDKASRSCLTLGQERAQAPPSCAGMFRYAAHHPWAACMNTPQAVTSYLVHRTRRHCEEPGL